VKLLVIGGTRFLGRHVVAEALAAGHTVTLFHRGKTGPRLFPEAEHLIGDRDGGLEVLRDRRWDAVVDTCAYVPRIARASAQFLRGAAEHYTLISSISAYAMPLAEGADETAALATLSDPATEVVDAASYGGLKAACEREVREAFGERALVVRAGLLVGPYDYMDRFAYWVRRFARGGDVLVPDSADEALQIVDARDVARWILRMAGNRAGGDFNMTGPERPFRLGDFFRQVSEILGAPSRLVPVPAAFLTERGVVPFATLPLWAPGAGGFLNVSIARALSSGIRFRPLAETVRDTRAWLEGPEAPAPGEPTVLAIQIPPSLSAERELELLEAWRSVAR
jgi:2'-hydroxyisoflavone reductase